MYKSNENQFGRYQRQLEIITESGQKRLRNAKVLIAGVGGLGSIVATYLTTSGIGEITLVDYDQVEITNLNRQFLHNYLDIGKKKVFSGLDKLSILNPEINIKIINEKISSTNVNDIIKNNTIIVDALDNIEARYLLSKVAYKKKNPLFHAAINGFYGQISTFLQNKENPCLFCFMSKNKKKLQQKNPVIPSTVGVVGSIQCNEVIKYIINQGELLIKKILIWNGLSNSIEYFYFEKDENCPICGKKRILGK